MELEVELKAIAELSRNNAAERDIETEVVQIFKKTGWPRLQINQDVPISDRATDRVDILLKLNDRPALLAEIKRYGMTRDAKGQVHRYCSLLRPGPKLAFLTDGVRWVIYYVGQADLIQIMDENVPQGLPAIISVLDAVNPQRLQALHESRVFDYIRLIE